MKKILYSSGKDLTEKQKEDIWEILKSCDEEFLPPLSQRTSTSQKNLGGPGSQAAAASVSAREPAVLPDPDAGPRAYYNEMICQEFLLAMEEEEMTGFMTFRQNYRYEKLPESFNPSLYMTTACVRREWREHGIMSSLYGCMETEMTARFRCPCITTRTWSTNTAQMHGLPQRGYQAILVLPDDRGPGVDTVYFGMIHSGTPE